MSTNPNRSAGHSRLPRLTLASAGLALIAGATACQGIGGNDGGRTTTSSSSGPTSSSTSSTSSPPRDGGLDDRSVVASRPATYKDISVRIDLLSLRRSGNLATLRFTATNTTPGAPDDTDKEWSIYTDLGSGPGQYDVSGVYLIDPAHSKKYPTASDSADDCVCSQTSSVDIVPTQSREFSATFAAPPADVAAVDVYVPGAGTIENVPVS
jgi:hypothetical protein